MAKHRYQSSWDSKLVEDAKHLVELALQEDLEGSHDWTTVSIVPEQATAIAHVVARKDGVFVGANIAEEIIRTQKANIELTVELEDGALISKKQTALTMSGNARDILSLERTILNFLGRLSGIATLTSKYVEQIKGTNATVCDTRKTTPGWRRLEKYAVHCGGGTNHRMGLFDAILIKDNHLAFSYQQKSDWKVVMRDAIRDSKKVAAENSPSDESMVVQVEVDNLQQLDFVLEEGPDIVLLDNMTLEQLRNAITMRDKQNANVILEASGGVNLETIGDISKTGVERISVGALTHSATNFDLGLDWEIGS